MRSPISACVRSSTKRSRAPRRSRGADRGHQPLERRALLGEAEVVRGGAERVGQVVPAVSSPVLRGRRTTSRGRRPRPRAPRARPPPRVDRLRDLDDRRLAAQVAAGSVATALSTLSASPRGRATRTDHVRSRKRRFSSPRMGNRVGSRTRLAPRVEAVDRLDEAERRDLDEVVERLVGALVAARELAGEREEPLGELLAGGLVARLELDEELAVLGLALGAARRCGGATLHQADRQSCGTLPCTFPSRPVSNRCERPSPSVLLPAPRRG